MTKAWAYLKGMCSPSVLQRPDLPGLARAATALLLIMIMVLIEWNGRRHTFPLAGLKKRSYAFQYFIYILFILTIFLWAGTPQQFIYFQF
ncbi:hypothetical protein D3C87_1705540 [compost metagenome]